MGQSIKKYYALSWKGKTVFPLQNVDKTRKRIREHYEVSKGCQKTTIIANINVHSQPAVFGNITRSESTMARGGILNTIDGNSPSVESKAKKAAQRESSLGEQSKVLFLPRRERTYPLRKPAAEIAASALQRESLNPKP